MLAHKRRDGPYSLPRAASDASFGIACEVRK